MKIRTNILLCSYVYFILMIVVCDYLTAILGLEYFAALSISFIGIIAVIYIFRKNIVLEKSVICWLDIVIIVLIISVCFLRGVIPDTSYDTSNYHVYFQYELDRDFVNYDFFPIRAVNASTIALGDRMFGCFHRILGYRMGTSLNGLCVIIIYFQLKEILTWVGKTLKIKMNRFLVCLLALICILTENIYSLLATYMIDLLSVPLLLQMLLLVLQSERSQDVNKKEGTPDAIIYWEALWLCLMAAMTVGIKISNAIIVVPLAICYIYKNIYKLKIRDYVVCLICIAGILAVYLYVSWEITGNPVFPLMNSVFKSPFFSEEYSPNDFSGFNSRFGPDGVLQTIFWPVYMLIYPEQTSDIPFCSGRLLISSVVILVFSIKEIKGNKKYQELMYYIAIWYLMFLFIFRGYMRYIIVLELLESAVALVLVYKYLKVERYQILCGELCIALVFQIGISGNQYFIKNWEWSWRNIHDKGTIVGNVKKVFSDYTSGLSDDILQDIDTLLVTDASGSMAYMLKDDVPIISLTTGTTNEETERLLQEKIANLQNEQVYSLCKREDFLSDVPVYSDFNFAISDIQPITPDFYDVIYAMPLVKVEKNEEVDVLESITSSDLIEYEIESDLSKLELFIGDSFLEPKGWESEYYVRIFLCNSETGEEYELNKVLVTQRGKYSKILIDTDIQKWDKVKIQKEDLGNSDGYVAVFQSFR